MDILQLYSDYSVDHKTEGHKHCRPGWVNTECPYCEGNPGYHLGYHLESDHYVCWRCGFHAVQPTIARLLKVNEFDVRKILKQYGVLIPLFKKESIIKVQIKSHHFPSGTEPLTERHKKYLEDRNFDPDYLEQKWNLVGTGPVSLLDGLNYKHRIIIPFFWNGQQVSFNGRDITNKSSYKYMECPADRELINHKTLLYGKQEDWKDSAICVEGPTDVWRFGSRSFGTSGIKYTPKQVRLIAKTFKRVAVCYDGEEKQALIQADALVGELRFRGVDSFRVDIEGDPGGMKQDEADYLVKQLIS